MREDMIGGVYRMRPLGAEALALLDVTYAVWTTTMWKLTFLRPDGRTLESYKYAFERLEDEWERMG